ncbi:hypothetical protein [Bacillus sp. AG4(2022)]|uniref:hypothetical protein n=1 Tax=Bacillus sp. AG4(2022) TaxID=2962594 RepID=UPI0028814034|nr:hypothetical protein [Bacillus sp. AG4(2022)]MDT0160274.1 hypothetical protein [Bacillus sp. AG4(2022)]
MSLANILQKPSQIDLIGDVYPVRVKDWDEFESYLSILMISKKHFNKDLDIPLLTGIVINLRDEPIVEVLCGIFNILTRTDSFTMEYLEDSVYFENKNKQIICDSNYDLLREVALHQNIIFEPKIYKDPLMARWAEKALEAKSKNAANITFEDMITTIATYSSKHYWDIENYSIYQLKAEFQRITRLKVYDTNSLTYGNSNVNPSEVKLDHFAESFDLYADPYKDLFKSKENLNISKALG